MSRRTGDTDGDRKGQLSSRQVGDELLWTGAHFYELPGDVWLMELRLKAPSGEHGEWMAVIKAVLDGQRVVAFVTAPTLDTLVHLVCAKLMNASMKWREDRPYGEQQQGGVQA